jgi:hypothetical protein
VIQRQRGELAEQRSHGVDRSGIEQIVRREAEPGQVSARQIAPAVTQVARQIAKDVGELERLAESHAEGAEARRVPLTQAGPVGHVHVRPELPDASRHQVRVAQEILAGRERLQLGLVLAGKVKQVLAHALHDRGEDRGHALAVVGGERAVRREDIGQPLEQPLLAGERSAATDRGDDAREPAGRGLGELGPQREEVADARLAVDHAGVGHGVGGAGEQVSQPDGRSHLGGEHGQREVERPADLFEDRPGQLGGHGLCPSRAPWG